MPPHSDHAAQHVAAAYTCAAAAPAPTNRAPYAKLEHRAVSQVGVALYAKHKGRGGRPVEATVANVAATAAASLAAVKARAARVPGMEEVGVFMVGTLKTGEQEVVVASDGPVGEQARAWLQQHYDSLRRAADARLLRPADDLCADILASITATGCSGVHLGMAPADIEAFISNPANRDHSYKLVREALKYLHHGHVHSEKEQFELQGEALAAFLASEARYSGPPCDTKSALYKKLAKHRQNGQLYFTHTLLPLTRAKARAQAEAQAAAAKQALQDVAPVGSLQHEQLSRDNLATLQLRYDELQHRHDALLREVEGLQAALKEGAQERRQPCEEVLNLASAHGHKRKRAAESECDSEGSESLLHAIPTEFSLQPPETSQAGGAIDIEAVRTGLRTKTLGALLAACGIAPPGAGADGQYCVG